jgi:hypothetical protein
MPVVSALKPIAPLQPPLIIPPKGQDKTSGIESPKDIYEPKKPCECSKCATRLYQDGSSDAGISMKAPTHIDPAMSRQAVATHEGSHVKRETTQAKQSEMKVASATVRLMTRACSECGRLYTSGGVTTIKVNPNIPIFKLMGYDEKTKARQASFESRFIQFDT